LAWLCGRKVTGRGRRLSNYGRRVAVRGRRLITYEYSMMNCGRRPANCGNRVMRYGRRPTSCGRSVMGCGRSVMRREVRFAGDVFVVPLPIRLAVGSSRGRGFGGRSISV
jgi:hypothetical protein